MTPTERKAAAAKAKAARIAKKEAKQAARKVEQARKRLVRLGVGKGIGPRLSRGITREVIAKEISERGDALLDWDAWLNGPVLEEVGDVLEKYDGPTLYRAALLIIDATHAAMVRKGVLAA